MEAWRAITAEALRDFGERDHYWTFEALKTANLTANAPVAPEKLVAIARRLVAKGRGDAWYSWHRIELGHALFRAGQDQAALSELMEFAYDAHAVPVIALIHARAGRAERARRWLTALEKDLEQAIREPHLASGELKEPYRAAALVLRAELLRRQAYAALGVPAPELRALRLLRGDSFWRLGENQKAETEFAAAIAEPPDIAQALIDRAWTFENLGLRDRSMADLALASRRRPDDPRPWVTKGRLLAARGLQSEADQAYARAAELAPGRLDPFLAAPWWVVGPYPVDMNRQSRPEEDHDPSHTVTAESGLPLRWKPAFVTSERGINLAPLAGVANSSVYALSHLYSASERTALFSLNYSGTVRVWLNGRVIFDTERQPADLPGLDRVFPAALRAGRNTLLVRVSHTEREHWMRLRTDDFELVRAHLLAESARWQEAADVFDLAEKRGQFTYAWMKGAAARRACGSWATRIATSVRSRRASRLERSKPFQPLRLRSTSGTSAQRLDKPRAACRNRPGEHRNEARRALAKAVAGPGPLSRGKAS